MNIHYWTTQVQSLSKSLTGSFSRSFAGRFESPSRRLFRFATLLCVSVVFSLVFLAASMSAFAASSSSSTNNGLITSGALINLNLVNQQPDPAFPGDVVDLRIGVVNDGNQPANNLVLEFIPSYPFELVDGASPTVAIGALQPYQGQTSDYLQIIKYQVRINKDAAARTYPVQFKVYQNGSLTDVTSQLNIDVSTATNGQAITIDKSVLVPGQITNVTFTVHNTGTAPLRSVAFSWSNAGGIILPVGSDNTQYASYIDVGDSRSFTYAVVADTAGTAGLYKLDLSLSYQNSVNSSSTTLQKSAGIYVGGGTDFDVALSDSASGSTSLSIANVGSNPANSVSVTIPPQPNWRVSGSSSAIIGNLNKGDYTVASFNIQSVGAVNETGIPSGAAGTGSNGYAGYAGRRGMGNYAAADNGTLLGATLSGASRMSNFSGSELLVSIAYTDTMGQRQTVFKSVVMSSGPGNSSSFGRGGYAGTNASQSSLSAYKWYILAIILIVVGFIFYRRRKQKAIMGAHTDDPIFFDRKKKGEK